MRFAQTYQMYERIPMKSKSVLPDEGFDCREINTADKWSPEVVLPVYCVVKPNKGYAKHRVFAICPCKRHVPFGRLGQHSKACWPLIEKFNPSIAVEV